MLYGNQSISTYTRSNVAIWMTMALQAGMLNIGAFLSCRQFASHVTGFATLFGLEIERSDYFHASGFLLVPLLFLSGAIISGFLVDLRLQMKKDPKYYVVFGVMFVLTLFVAIAGFNNVFGEFGRSTQVSRDFTLLAFLSFICGLQNGTITSVSKSVVRTTHLTGITTDLGIGLVRVLNKRMIAKDQTDEVRANKMRIGLITSFILGSILGAYSFSNFGYRGFFIPAVLSGGLFVVTLYFRFSRKTPAES